MMAKLLVVGLGPLLEEGRRRIGGQCLRTWYFTKPLLDDGHAVRLVTIPIYDPDDPHMNKAALTRHSIDGFQYQSFSNCDFAFIDHTLAELTHSFDPDAIIAVNIIPAWVAARLPSRAPLWADLNGYEMAEKQGQAARTGDDSALVDAWHREALVARRADKLSTVSRPQLHALLGEMAGLGRLNQHTFHYHFAHHIPNAAHPLFLPPDDAPPQEIDGERKGPLRNKIVPSDAFVLLWSGGYNYWTDPQFLFDFLEGVFKICFKAHYVSTGGAIAGYNDQTYATFQDLVEKSPYRQRYHLLGWLPAAELPAIYRDSDLGLNIDEPNYETYFGARNRVNNLMASGLPVLTTAGSEISLMIDEAECGSVCPPSDLDGLIESAVELANNPEKCRALGARALQFAREEFAPERLIEPVRDWALSPFLAPDNAEKLRIDPNAHSFRHTSSNPLDTRAAIVEEADLPTLQKAQIDLDAIRGKGWYRRLKKVKDFALDVHRLIMKCIGVFKKKTVT